MKAWIPSKCRNRLRNGNLSKPAWQRLIIMLGSVTVNLILGFLIYIMILFVWGKNILPNSSLPMGLGVTPLAEKVGLEEGDQIILVDGKKLDIALDINKLLLIRGVKKLIERANGRQEIIQIPKILVIECLSLAN